MPTSRFFMRSNGPVPLHRPPALELTASTGHVERDLVLRLDDLRAMPQRTITAFLECAGNGRTRFDPVPEGTPWVNDAAGNAVWERCPACATSSPWPASATARSTWSLKAAIFRRCGAACRFAVACDPDTLVVLEMNGEPLPLAHGGPARLLVPGWAGIASTKWLVGLEVLDHAFAGFWNSDNYVYWSDDGTPLRPVTEMPVKSIIAVPRGGACSLPGQSRSRGTPGRGRAPIDRVEISVDGGGSWERAGLKGADAARGSAST